MAIWHIAVCMASLLGTCMRNAAHFQLETRARRLYCWVFFFFPLEEKNYFKVDIISLIIR